MVRQALDAGPDLGVFLPCNVVMYETDDSDIVISAVDPRVMLSVAENPELGEVAGHVSDAFDRILDSFASPMADPDA